MPSLLVIDDDRAIHQMVAKAFSHSDLNILSAKDADEALAKVRTDDPDVILLDIQLPETSGLELFKQIQSLAPKVPTIFITASESSETAIEAVSIGAFDYVLKPLDLSMLVELIENALEARRLMQVRVELPGPSRLDTEADSIIGRSTAMQEVYKAIGRAAPQDVIVLIRGESGTGKELVARAIYQHSNRSSGPFLEINCAAIPDTLLESELFGHEKGSFTGADQRRIGKFERCSGGTIFLDEVGDMSPLIQSKVLRILQEQRFERVGGSSTLETDVRIIAATNRNLEKMVAKGQFREDLYYRLNGYAIQLPPLRERGDDLQLLIEYYLKRLNQLLGKEVHTITPEAAALLASYPWPGNVRELQCELNRAILKTAGPSILPASLSATITEYAVPNISANMHPDEDFQIAQLVQAQLDTDPTDLYAKTLEVMERCLFTQVLRKTNGNQSQASSILGITRGSLRNKLRQLNITIQRSATMNELSPAHEEDGVDALPPSW